MQLPPSFNCDDKNRVCHLHKSLYGIKQASKQWYSKISEFLCSHGYKQSFVDHSLYLKFNNSQITALLIYVDDVILVGDDIAEINSITNLLDHTFKIKNLGNLTYFLGFEVARSSKGIQLCQRKYTTDILSEARMLGSTPTSTPMNFSRHKNTEIRELLFDSAPFRRLIGRLIYLTHTSPDITFTMHHLSQFIATPTSLHHRASMQIIRYLKQHPRHGIFFDSTSNLHLKAFCDSDWAGCPDTRRSVTGYIIYIGKSPICWKSKKQ